MRVSTIRSLDLVAESAYYAYRTDPECIARRALLDRMIDPDEYGDLFVPGWGRPSWPVDMMLRAMYVQKEEGWSDRQLASQLKNNLRVRFLVGLPSQGKAPKRSTFIDFRKRLIARQKHTLPLDQQQRFIAQTGLVTPGDRMIIDSTPYLTAAAQPTVVGLLQHAMRRLLLALRQYAPELVADICARLRLKPLLAKRFQRCASGLVSRPGRRLWGLFYRKANKLLKALPPDTVPQVEPQRALLARVLDERGPDGSGQVPDRVTNVMDADARFGCKGQGGRRRTWHGYKHTLITHAQTDLILSQHVMPAQQVDGDALLPALDALRPAFAYPAQLDGDEAYTSQDNRRAARRLSVCLIGPRRTKKRRGQVPGGGRVATRADRGQRSRVEHVVAHIVRWRHNRRSPYLGITKASLQAALAACATNFVRLLSLWRERRLVLPGAPAPAAA